MTRSMPQLPLVLPREEKMEEYEVSSVVRGFHVYQRSWSQPSLEEQLECLREAGNDKDRYDVAVLRHGSVVGHIPRISAACSLFIGSGVSSMELRELEHPPQL